MLFVHCQRNGGDWYGSYVGMDQDTVGVLLNELGCTSINFISADDYTAATARH
jgi:hypothetical protein